MIHPYQRVIDRFHTKDIFSKKHVLDNEDSSKYKEVIKKNGMEYKLVMAHMHLQNLV